MKGHSPADADPDGALQENDRSRRSLDYFHRIARENTEGCQFPGDAGHPYPDDTVCPRTRGGERNRSDHSSNSPREEYVLFDPPELVASNKVTSRYYGVVL